MKKIVPVLVLLLASSLSVCYFTTMKPGASQEKEWLGTAQWKLAGAWCVIDTNKQQ